MSDFNLILSVAFIHLIGLISPGPDFVMAVKNSITYSRKIGIYTAIGFGLGIVIHVSYTFLGIGIIIKESPSIYNAIKYLGAAYLFYIGVQSIFSKAKERTIEKNDSIEEISNFQAIRIGFVTNVLNPKATMFFLSFFTVIIGRNVENFVLGILAILVVLQTMLWFSIVAVFFTNKKIQKLYYYYEKKINIFFGVILILFAINIVFFS